MAISVKIKNYLFLLVFAGTLPLFSDAVEIYNIKEIIDGILALHIEHKEINPTIAGRAFKTYLQRFDPYHIYLLEAEAAEYLSPSEKRIRAVSEEYKKGQFGHLLEMSKLASKATLRARTMRSFIRTRLLKEKKVDNVEIYLGELGYPKTTKDLECRIEKQMRSWLSLYAIKHNTREIDAETRLKILHHYEKKRRAIEDPYLLSSNKVSLCIAKALAAALDSHTMVYSEEEASDIRLGLHKQFFGVGLYLREEVEGPIVSGFVPNSPAERCGLVAEGDLLDKINHLPTEHLSFKEVLQKLDGENQSTVTLTFRTPKGEKKKISLTREKVVLESDRIQVAHEPFLDGVIGKINLSAFYDNGSDIRADQDLKEAIQELKSKGPLYGLILDMRDNHGGFLHQAVKICSLFVQKGVIVVAKYADEEIRYARDLDLHACYLGPLVVLTSKASASAAEVVAQSLKDFGAGVIVGDEQTYGKGSMQVQTLTDQGAKYFFKATVGRYYTASGSSTQLKGVSADINVASQYAPYDLGERYLLFPLAGDHICNRSDLRGDLKKLFAGYQGRSSTVWELMIPKLRENSTRRLIEDRNYQAFLQHIYGVRREGTKLQPPTYGKEDIQLKEAVNIVKDMHRLQKKVLSGPKSSQVALQKAR